ncbi:hypothetical protein FGO68_gene895 [Halteria grandinella]|uniref:Uncharacterized protein n=1 Tax=Halteria grandinella TaxID=5974 RepID=A0A8J8TAT2_HALGN|nr:hypothetical protein FGO68_gene895 [Halteria grandinella]
MSWNVGTKIHTLPNASDAQGSDFTISVYDYYNSSSLPSFVNFNGDKTITYSPLLADAGEYILEVKLTDGQPKSSIYRCYVYVTNTVPDFSPSLTNKNLYLNGVPVTYHLPPYSDPDGTACTISVKKIFGSVRSSLPTFITFADDQFVISPGQYEFTSIGTHQIEVNLTDTTNQLTQRYFSVVISNQSPFFSTYPTNWSRKLATATYTYALPTYSDPEGHTILVSVYEIATKTLPPFMTFANDVLTMTVLDTDFAYQKSFYMRAKLNDTNQYNSYDFTISLTNTAPTFLDSLQTQICPLNGTVFEYVLPTQFDNEGQTIIATTKEYGKASLPAFVTFDGLQYTIAPGLTEFQYVGLYNIEIILSDGNKYCAVLPHFS